MIGNIARLADLLSKDKLSVAERREGITLAQAMFGSTAHAHGDHAIMALRRKAISGANDPAGLVAKNTVIGKVDGAGDVGSDDVQLEPGQFKIGEDLYAANKDKAGRDYYTKNGGRISKAAYEDAQREAAGTPDAEES